MRICFLTSTYPRNSDDGIGSFVRGLAETLVHMGHSVTVIAPDDPAIAPMNHMGVEVHRFRYPPWDDRHLIGHARGMVADERLTSSAPLLLPGFMFSALAKMLRLHRQAPFDLVHGHWLLPGGVMAAAAAGLTGLPLVIGLHGSGVHFARRSRVFGAVASKALRRTSHVIACSPNLRDGALGLGLAPESVSVVPYGVQASSFASGDGTGLRLELGLTADQPVVGAIGRLSSKKGFDRLIAAMPAVLSKHPEARCVIGGDGDLRESLETQVDALGLSDHVLFAGQLPWTATPDFYAMCDILVVPSVASPGANVDGLPNVLLEAMASGCALVASRVAGIPTAIDSGRNGLLVPPDDVPALTHAVVSLLSDGSARRRLGVAAQADMAARFSWEAHAREVLGIYQRALDGGA